MDDAKRLELTHAQQAALDTHLQCCEACASEWRAAEALWEMARAAAPAPRPELFAETMRLATTLSAERSAPLTGRRSFWLGASVGGAIAAGIVVAIMSFGLAPSVQQAENDAVPAISIALNELREVGVAIDSAEALEGAEIRVVLTGGVRLAGFEDRHEIRWREDLASGVNRLNLPIVAVDAAGGQVLVEVEHSSKRKIFVINVGVDAPADDLAGLRAVIPGAA